MFPFPVHVRSFAPFKEFGGWFKGDNRGFSTALNATARAYQSFTANPAQHSLTDLHTGSSPSSHPVLGDATAKDDRGSITQLSYTDNKDGSTAMNFTASMAAHNPLVPGSPDINVHTNFTITENDKAGTLMIDVEQKGDKFPSAETFIGDTKGNQLFIGISSADRGTLGPFISLPGNNFKPMMTSRITVTMDSKGVFTGVKQGDKTYTLSDWNKLNEKQPVQQH